MTYRDIMYTVKGHKLPLSCKNECFENSIIEDGKDEEGHFYKLTVAQSNGWCRVIHYYETGAITEEYMK